MHVVPSHVHLKKPTYTQTQGNGKVHTWEIRVRHTQHKVGAASHHVTTTYTRLIDKDTVFIQDERFSYLQRDRQRNFNRAQDYFTLLSPQLCNRAFRKYSSNLTPDSKYTQLEYIGKKGSPANDSTT